MDLFQYYYSGSHRARQTRQSYCIAPWSDRTQGPADSSADTGWVPLLPGKKMWSLGFGVGTRASFSSYVPRQTPFSGVLGEAEGMNIGLGS